jgi:hypothetical protein
MVSQFGSATVTANTPYYTQNYPHTMASPSIGGSSYQLGRSTPNYNFFNLQNSASPVYSGVRSSVSPSYSPASSNSSPSYSNRGGDSSRQENSAVKEDEDEEDQEDQGSDF